MLSNLAFRATLACASCFISVKMDGLEDFHEAFRGGSSVKPVVIVANHTSFLDVMLALSMMPLAASGNVKMFVSNHLVKMPFLGSIVRGMEHLVVPFKAVGSDGGFEIDKELMAERMATLKAHVENGGTAAWFPEGKINAGNPCELQQFRAGGFSLPCEVDCDVWCISFVGNSQCWPRNSMVGGSPCKIHVKLTQLCSSSAAFLFKAGLAKADGRDRALFLATASQRQVQGDVSDLARQHAGASSRLLASF